MTDEPEFVSLLKFPCDFPIKVMGKNTPDFEDIVLNIVRRHFPTIDVNTSISQRLSKDATYIALTIVVSAQSKEQLDKLYLEITATPEVLMSF